MRILCQFLLILANFALLCYSDEEQHDAVDGSVGSIKPIDGVARKLGESAMIGCVPSVAGAELSWYKKDSLLTSDEQKYNINNVNFSLTILHVGIDDLGVYQCEENDNLRANVTLYSAPFVRSERSMNRYVGGELKLECRARGLPLPSVTWYGNDKLILSDGKRVTVSNVTDGVTNGLLSIDSLLSSDYMIYTCVATNRYDTNNGTTLVRVKSRWGVVWPIIGIIIQLCILALIIFFYERRKKKEMEVEKRREEEFNKSHPVESTGPRQRKSN